MSIHKETTIVRVSNFVSSPVGDELVMFCADRGKYYGLNAIATVIWQLIERPLSVNRLCEELIAIYDVTPEKCLKDVLHHLEELNGKGLVRILQAISNTRKEPGNAAKRTDTQFQRHGTE